MKRTPSKLLIVLLAVALGFASCRSGQDKIQLELNLKPGEKYKYTTRLDQDINSMGMVNVNLKFTIDLIYKMLPKENDLKKLAVTYDHLAMEGTNPMGSMRYDSDVPDQNPRMSEIGNLVGKTYYVFFNKDGTINRVEGVQQLIDSVVADPHRNMTDSSFKVIMQNAFNVYPGKPVAVGESWTRSSKMGISSFQFDVQNTYTLASVEDGIAHISLRSELSLPETALKETQKMKMEMTGRQKGTINIEVATGRILSGETTQHIEGAMKAGGQSIPMTIKSTIHTKSEKL